MNYLISQGLGGPSKLSPHSWIRSGTFIQIDGSPGPLCLKVLQGAVTAASSNKRVGGGHYYPLFPIRLTEKDVKLRDVKKTGLPPHSREVVKLV